MNLSFTRRGLSFFATFLISILALTAAADAEPDASLADRGKYLTEAGDCHACHTKPGGEPFAGGRSIETPFGTIASPNITPDKETGIGKYSDDQFYRALHEGIGAGGEYLYPVFPFASYTKVTREDAMAIKAYLFSQKPVRAPSEANNLAFPYNIRSSLLVWRELFFRPSVFELDPTKTSQINRGAYLVQGLGHCGECHTKRNFLGATERGDALQGAAVQGWYAPNITSDWASGIGSWSEDELFSYLKTGVAPRRGIVAGPMAEVVHDSLSRLSDDDVRAIAAYLKSTPPKAAETVSNPQPLSSSSDGATVYVTNCASCHQLRGQGVDGKIPPLAENGSVKASGPQNVISTVLAGLPATASYGPMPSFAAVLNDEQIASVANYVRTNWGNGATANAEAFLVSQIRRSSATMVGFGDGQSQCPANLSSGEKAVLDSASTQASDLLQSTTGDNLVTRVAAIVPKIKAAVPGASPADVVNGLTAAYCPNVAKQTRLSASDKRQLLDKFSQLAYTQVSGGITGGAQAAKGANLQ